MSIQTRTAPDGAMVIALDTHVHLYPDAQVATALNAGRDSLEAGARRQGVNPDAFGLMLTETIRDNAFGALASGERRAKGWRIDPVPGDPVTLLAQRDADGAQIYILAGRQIVSSEGIEVLALATTETFTDRRPIAEILSDLDQRGIPAVLPWGLGKWFKQRGKQVRSLSLSDQACRPILADNAGRPQGWPTPALFRQAHAENRPILAGTDPLPLPGSESVVGRYGTLIDSAPGAPCLSQALRDRLLHGAPCSTIGTRRSLRAVIAEQVALRRRKA